MAKKRLRLSPAFVALPVYRQNTLRHQLRRGLLLLALLPLLLFMGPASLCAYQWQRWATRDWWHAPDRWGSIVIFSMMFPWFNLFLVWAFWQPLADLWLALPGAGIHLLLILALWWVALLPFSPDFARLLERIHPKTITHLTRILLPNAFPLLPVDDASAFPLQDGPPGLN